MDYRHEWPPYLQSWSLAENRYKNGGQDHVIVRATDKWITVHHKSFMPRWIQCTLGSEFPLGTSNYRLTIQHGIPCWMHKGHSLQCQKPPVSHTEDRAEQTLHLSLRDIAIPLCLCGPCGSPVSWSKTWAFDTKPDSLLSDTNNFQDTWLSVVRNCRGCRAI